MLTVIITATDPMPPVSPDADDVPSLEDIDGVGFTTAITITPMLTMPPTALAQRRIRPPRGVSRYVLFRLR